MRIYINLILVYLCVLTQHESAVNATIFGRKSTKTSATSKTTSESEPLNSNNRRSSTSLTRRSTSAPLTSVIPSDHTFNNYENLIVLNTYRLCIVYKGISKTTGQQVLITKSTDVSYERIPHEIEILKLLHSKAIELNWPRNYGLMILIAHGKLKTSRDSIFTYPISVTELLGDSVYDRYSKSLNKIVKGRKLLSFRTTCLLGCALASSLERLNAIGVAHGNLSMQVMRLKLKLRKDSSGDKISDFVLADLASSRIYKKDGYIIQASLNPIQKLDALQLKYTSADVIEGHPVRPSSDVWSLFYIIMVSLGGNAPNDNGINLRTTGGRVEYLRRKRNPDLIFPEVNQKRSIELTTALLTQARAMSVSTVNYQILRNILQKAMTESERLGDEFDWYPKYKK